MESSETRGWGQESETKGNVDEWRGVRDRVEIGQRWAREGGWRWDGEGAEPEQNGVVGDPLAIQYLTVLLDTNHWLISDKSVPFCFPPLYPPLPKSIPISITSLTLLCLSLFPLSHLSSLCFLFHWYPLLCHYDPLVSHLSFLPPHSCHLLFHTSAFCS